MRVSGRRIVRTMCPMSCHPTLCGMLVEVEDGRLVKISGDHDNPDSQGFLCVRGQASREIIGNPKRLLRPLIRTRRSEDAWHEASWDEALDLIVSRMQAVGREAVGIWSGHGNAATNYGTRIGGQLMRPGSLWTKPFSPPSLTARMSYLAPRPSTISAIARSTWAR
jgi:anaerobic selenocysteine-containing dehydrogenase